MDSNGNKKNQKVTIYDIAEKTGFSYSTVSRVLNGYEFVKESTRQQVLEVANQLGYVANLQARSLAGGKSHFIGLLAPGLDNGYIGGIARGVDEALVDAGYGLMLFTTHNHEARQINYVNSIVNGSTAGLIVLVPLLPQAYLEAMQEQNFPFVILDESDFSVTGSIVDTTNWQGAYNATRYLIEMGHKRIAHITGVMRLKSAVDRLDGYKSALQANNIAVNDDYIVEGDYLLERGREAATQLLALDTPPTAIVAGNDFTAFGAMEAARAKGLEIPDDISIIGFDDIPHTEIAHPKLTTVKQPLEQMGKVAVKLLLEHIEDSDNRPKHITLATELIIRDSCAPPEQ